MRLLHSEDEWLQHLRRWNNMPEAGPELLPSEVRLMMEMKMKDWERLTYHVESWRIYL